MIAIHKNTEPNQLTEYRKMPDASYRNMHGAHLTAQDHRESQKDVYSVVLNSLLTEQGHLCAYCMQRIPEKDGKATIEHIVPQSADPARALDYHNMLAVCNGNRDARDDSMKTCDAHRGNTELTVNPLHPQTLNGVGYRRDGHIYSTDEEINHDLDVVLNLNCIQRRLPENRRSALDVYLRRIRKEHPTGDISVYCERELERLRSMPYKLPYVGVIEHWLERHCRSVRR